MDEYPRNRRKITTLRRSQLPIRVTIDTLRVMIDTLLHLVYQQRVPFHKGQNKAKQELDDAMCIKALDKLIVEMPLVDAVCITPTIKSTSSG